MTPLDEELSVFNEFPKIYRLSRDMVVTEKIDGTNASVTVFESGIVRGASRNRWVTLQEDNAGFARWVAENETALRELGPGRHFGEWWGKGIQIGYGLQEKRFSLFNVTRWEAARPACCGVVPVLYRGPFSTEKVDEIMAELAIKGSVAAPGFMKPEGVVVFHTQGNFMLKKTFKGDQAGKSYGA